eukprot:scpid84739/ scgid8087/ Sugar transporter SWEET1; RAG1-activating protein 1; Solute carrier family 50 member 1
MTTVQFLSWASVGTNIILYSTGISRCREFHEQKSTGNVSPFPFIATILNCIFWLAYGMLQNDALIWEVNIVGLTMQTIYVLFFIYYAEHRNFVIRMLVACGGCSSAIVYIMFYVSITRPVMAATWLGFICNGLTIIMFASPLSTLPEVMRTKSTASMSVFLTVATFICAVAWTAYGYVVDDIFLIVPNGVGCFLGGFQCMLFCVYPLRTKSRYIDARPSVA